MKKILLTESEKAKILSEREKLILESFAKTFNSIKRIDEAEINELSPELKHRAYQQADAERSRFGNSQGGEHNDLKSDRRDYQTVAFSEIHPSIKKEADDIAKYVIPGGSASVTKVPHHKNPYVLLTFAGPKAGYPTHDELQQSKFDSHAAFYQDRQKNEKILTYKITKNEVDKVGHSNVGVERNIGSRIERLTRKIQNTEIPSLEGENELEEDFKSNLKGAAAGAAALAGGLNANAQQAPQAHQKISPGMQIQAPQAANTKAVDGKTADPFNTQKSGGDEESKYAQNHTKPIVDMARGQDGKTGKDAIFLYHVPKNQVTNRTIDQDRTTVYLNNFDKQVKGTPEWRDYVARCKALGLQIGAFAPIDTDYEGRDQSAAITKL